MNKDKASNEASDEEIIFSESKITIKGELITVAEISYMQGLDLHAPIQPMITEMATAFADDDADYTLMAGVFAKHKDLVNTMIVLTTNKDKAWLESLKDEEGQAVLMTFWLVNRGFFTRRLVSKAFHQMQLGKQAGDQASPSTMAASSVN